MKKYTIIAAVLLVVMALCPLAAMGSAKEKTQSENQAVISYSVENKTEYITVMSSSTGGMQKIEMREYLIGCVAAEMPANYHPEALKAQVIASYSYAKRMTEKSEEYITDSPLTHQGYVNRQGRIQNWGEDFEENEKKISEAVDAVFGKRLIYGDETALAVYHSISSGETRSAESMWGKEIPYLQNVASAGDRLSPDFIQTQIFSQSDFADKLGLTAGGDASEWVEKIEKDNGYVAETVICGKTFSGNEIRELLNLNSSSFEIEFDGDFTVISEGHGHGVGMSQYGADYMARQGSDCEEILMHYYPGTKLSE